MDPDKLAEPLLHEEGNDENSNGDERREPSDAVAVDLTVALGVLVPVADTYWPCVSSLTKIILGAGMMALPKALYTLGLWSATLLLLGVAFLAYFTLSSLAQVSDKQGAQTYNEVVQQLCGPVARASLQVSILLFCFGLMVVYINVIGDVLVGSPQSCTGLLCDLFADKSFWFLDRRLVLAVVMVVMVLPGVSLRSSDRLAPLGVFGMAAITLFTLALMGMVLSAAPLHQLEPIPLWPNWDVMGGSYIKVVLTAVDIAPIFLTCFVCHQSLLGLKRLVQPYSTARMTSVIWSSVAVSTVLYGLVALCGSLLFGAFADGNLLNNITPAMVRTHLGRICGVVVYVALKLSYALSLFASYVLYMQPLRSCAVELVRGTGSDQLPDRLFYPVTYVLAALTYVVAVLQPSVWHALMTVGGVASTVQGFIIPALLVLSTENGSGWQATSRRALAVLVGVLGAVLFVNTLVRPFL